MKNKKKSNTVDNSKSLKTKLFFYFFAFILFLFSTSEMGIVDSEKSAIIVGIGIDKNTEVANPDAPVFNNLSNSVLNSYAEPKASLNAESLNPKLSLNKSSLNASDISNDEGKNITNIKINNDKEKKEPAKPSVNKDENCIVFDKENKSSENTLENRSTSLNNPIYELSCQVAITSKEGQSASVKQTIITTKGTTLAEALNMFMKETGWYPNLFFCNLVVLSEEVAREGLLDYIEFLVRSERILDSAIIAISNEKAKDILSDITPLDNISAFALQKVIFGVHKDSNYTAISNIKTFMSNYTMIGADNTLPIISKLKFDYDESTVSSQDPTKPKASLFVSSETAVFSDDKLVSKLDFTETQGYALSVRKLKQSFYTVTDVRFLSKPDEVMDVGIMLDSTKNKTKISIKNNRIECSLNVDIKAYSVATEKSIDSFEKISTSAKLPNELIVRAKSQMEDSILSCFQKAKEAKADIFRIGSNLHKDNPQKWKGFLSSLDDMSAYLDYVDFYVSVSITSQNTK